MTDYHDLLASVACTLSSLLPPKYRWRDADVRETVATLMAKHDRGVDYAIGDRLHKAERGRVPAGLPQGGHPAQTDETAGGAVQADAGAT
jgi:hypothetical protein